MSSAESFHCLLRPSGDRFKIIFESEERMFHDFLSTESRKTNINACTKLHWYYAYWHTHNLKKQQQRRQELFSGTRKKSKQPQLIADPKLIMELEYILYITTDIRTLEDELNLNKTTIEKTINIFLDPEIWNYTDPLTGKKLGILSDESHRKEEFHRMRVLPYNPLIKRNRWLLFHPEIYNNYSASLQISEEYIREKHLEQQMNAMQPYFESRLIQAGWQPPSTDRPVLQELPETKPEKPVQTEQPEKKEKLWPAFIEWAEKSLTDRTRNEIKNLHLSEDNGQILISGHSSKMTRTYILKYFTDKGFTKIRFEEKAA